MSPKIKREQLIQEIMEDSSRLKQLALADRSRLGALQLSKAQLELIHLLYFHDKITVKQTAGHLSVSVSAVSQLTDPLYAEGYLRRQNDPKDRRIIYLSLTPKGRKVIKNLRHSLRSGFRAIMETLDQRDLATLNRIYKKLVANATSKQLND